MGSSNSYSKKYYGYYVRMVKQARKKVFPFLWQKQNKNIPSPNPHREKEITTKQNRNKTNPKLP